MKKKIVLVGCGKLGRIIADGICGKLRDRYELSGVYGIPEKTAEEFSEIYHCQKLKNIEEMVESAPDYVIEAAAVSAVHEIAEPVLKAGIDLILLSVGGLADDQERKRVEQIAKENGSKIYIASGAIGGFDLMRALMFDNVVDAGICTTKNPKSLNGAPYLKGETLPEKEKTKVYSGTSREAIQGFPQNVNVAVALALATNGLDDTKVQIFSDPDVITNHHCISLQGEFGRVSIDVEVKPIEKHTKSSVLAAWSVLALLEKFTETIVI